MDLSRLKAIKDKQAQEAKEKALATKQELSQLKNQELIVQVAKSVVDFMAGHTTKTVVLNQLEDFATSQNVKELVKSITSLHDTLKTHENTDISPLTEVMESVLEEVKLIPKEHPKEKEEKFVDYTSQIKSLTDAVKLVEKSVKAQKLIAEAPVVNIDAPVVNVEAQDLKPLAKELEKAFTKAVGGIPKPKAIDLKPVVDEQKKQTKLLRDIRDMPMGGGGGGSASIAPFLVDGALPITGSITAEASTLADFGYNDKDNTTTVDTTYYGYTKPDGTWLVKKLTDTTLRYATITNNGAVTTYADAWAAIASLTYGRMDQAF